MLKIMKYEWQSGFETVRTLLLAGVPLAIVVGLVHRFFHISELGIILLAWAIALAVLTAIAVFRNMTIRMFGPEGYLTHTLPVETWELLAGKAVGTWLFVVSAAAGAAICWTLFLVSDAGFTAVGDTFVSAVQALPKLGGFHFEQLEVGGLYIILGAVAFLAFALLAVFQFQFACVISEQFGKYQIAGGVIAFVLPCLIGAFLNAKLFIGFLFVLLFSAACFVGSHWLLKNRLSL